MSNFYAGVRVFEPLSTKVGLNVDQFNFVFCMFVSCLMGRQFQTKYDIKRISADQRHMFAFLGGFTLILFCFRHQVMHLFILICVTYILITYLSYKHSRYIVFVFNMSYLAFTHLARQYWDYGGYTMDITGPMMIMVQRMSMLAFNLYDGDQIKRKKELDFADAGKHAVSSHPTPLQFFSYAINFPTVIIGPFVFYSDYLRFIEGREVEYAETVREKEYFNKHRKVILAAEEVTKQYIVMMIVFGTLHKFVFPFFQPSYYLTEEFSNFSLVNKIFYLILVSPMLRQQYYFAWSFTSLSALSSGMGFTGFNKKTFDPEYKIIENFDLKNIETAPNITAIIQGWNKTANVWLKECVYTRLPKSVATPAVFVCSAIWHGFYPGYYLFFFTAGCYLVVSRAVRRYIRPYFLVNMGDGRFSKVYDVLTMSVTVFCLNYMALPFVLLEFSKSFQFWRQFYFIGHLGIIGMLLAVFLVPKPRKSTPKPTEKQDHPVEQPSTSIPTNITTNTTTVNTTTPSNNSTSTTSTPIAVVQ